MIHVCSFREAPAHSIDTTSKAGWSRGLSPFVLGPVDLYDGMIAKNVENAWQFSKVYPEHEKGGKPTSSYWEWAKTGWNDSYAHRYPMGKGRKPLFSWWKGKPLGYVDARKRIYAPLYAECVMQSDAYKRLKSMYKKSGELWLKDYDAYNHRKLGMSYNDVINCPERKMGHAFVLAMMLEGCRCW